MSHQSGYRGQLIAAEDRCERLQCELRDLRAREAQHAREIEALTNELEEDATRSGERIRASEARERGLREAINLAIGRLRDTEQTCDLSGEDFYQITKPVIVLILDDLERAALQPEGEAAK